jgi:hypothetical protein
MQGSTGLFPLEDVADDQGRKPSLSDLQTDMSVALLKLSEVSKEQKYADAAKRCLRAYSQLHFGPYGLFDAVDVDTGAPLDTTSKTKFLALSIKAWIALKNFGTLTTSPNLRQLLADR